MTEVRLLADAQRGDDAAFELLVERHRRELYAHCYRMLGSAQDAEDARADLAVPGGNQQLPAAVLAAAAHSRRRNAGLHKRSSPFCGSG